MPVSEYCFILDEMRHPQYGNVFQVALGGGEPLEHPDFKDIITETLRRNIVPNFTTNGIHLTSDIADFCGGKVGAVAVSTESIKQLNQNAINILVAAKVKTNIHYVLNNENMDEATELLQGKYDNFLEGVNAVIFLTYKPAGRGQEQYVIRKGKSLELFVGNIKKCQTNIRIGFDACFVPILMRNKVASPLTVDTCEGGFFSVYIDENCNVSPCSFSNGKDSFSLREYSFYEIWLNKLGLFRKNNENRCKSKCEFKSECRGCCAYYPQITPCYE